MRIFSPAIVLASALTLSPVVWKLFSPVDLWSCSCAEVPRALGASCSGRCQELLGTDAFLSLLDDLGDSPSTNSPATLTDGEPKALFHSDRLNQLYLHLGVVTGQHHFGALRQAHDAGHVGGTEVELRTVVVEERRVPATLVL